MADTTKAPATTVARTQTPFLGVFDELHNEINRMFDRFTHNGGKYFTFPDALRRVDIVPTVDVAQKDDAYEISAELPGVLEKDITLSVEGGLLTLKGEKKIEKEEKKKDSFVSERSYGSFARTFSLPDDAAQDKIDAHFVNGVLKIEIPRNKAAKPTAKQIPVKAG